MDFSRVTVSMILIWSLAVLLAVVSGGPGPTRDIVHVTGSQNEVVFSNKTQSGKRFVGYNSYMNFLDYIEFCHKNNMQPAEVVSAEENAVLTSYLDGNFAPPKYFWLGGADIGREGRYYWIASLSEFTYNSWYPGYPNGGRDENCATIYGGDGSWYDQYCTNDGVQPLCQVST